MKLEKFTYTYGKVYVVSKGPPIWELMNFKISAEIESILEPLLFLSDLSSQPSYVPKQDQRKY